MPGSSPGMTSHYLLQRLQQTPHQQGARLDRRDQAVLPLGVRAVAVDAEAIERRHPKRCGEIAVAAAAGHLGVLQIEPDSLRDRLRVTEQHFDRRGHLERGAVHPAGDLDLHAGIDRLEPEDPRLQLFARPDVAHAQVDRDMAVLRNDVRRGAAGSTLAAAADGRLLYWRLAFSVSSASFTTRPS